MPGDGDCIRIQLNDGVDAQIVSIRIALVELPDTLVVPPARPLEIKAGMLKRLAALERKARRK